MMVDGTGVVGGDVVGGGGVVFRTSGLTIALVVASVGELELGDGGGGG